MAHVSEFTDAGGGVVDLAGAELNLWVLVELALLLGIGFFTQRLISGLKRKRVKYIDTGQEGSFRSEEYRIVARPDVIENGTTIVENKSRRRGVYDSDRKQLIATALAVRSKYRIREGYIKTQTQREFTDLSGSDAALFNAIRIEHQYAEMVANGIKPPPSPARNKCKGCQFTERCEFSAA